MPRESPTGGFNAAYRSAGGPDLVIFVGKTFGILARTAVRTVVVVIVLRLLGVL
ncbi:hypothetical protein ABIE28_002049 [Devosia sp. 2618]